MMDGDTIEAMADVLEKIGGNAKSVLCISDCQYSLKGKCTRESISMRWYFNDEIGTRLAVCDNYVR